MAYDYFPENGSRYRPSYGLSRKPEANVIVNNFGDGYEQRIPVGKNHIKEKLTLSWQNIKWSYTEQPDDYEDGNVVYEFLYNRLKITPFYFRQTEVSPYKLYICEEVSYSASQFSLVNISATFSEYRGI